jgi:hypothetical protein
MFFLLFLHDDRRIRIQIRSRILIRIHTPDKGIWIRIREAQKHVDPVDPDPDLQHCFRVLQRYSTSSFIEPWPPFMKYVQWNSVTPCIIYNKES